MLGEPESIVCNPPGPSDDATDRVRSRPISVPASASTVLVDVGFNQCWIAVTADQDVTIRGSLVSTIGDAVVGDWPLWQKSYHQFWVNGDRYLKFRGMGTAATVWIYVSNR